MTMETKSVQSVEIDGTVYTKIKPRRCEAPVQFCTECPYDECLYDCANHRMRKNEERGYYKKSKGGQ